jgi:hypothetical protein
MAADREPPSLADHVVTAISPALVMLMVGSLVFFLITVLPTGDYKERLLYTSFFFVFGAVLVARISIQYDAARAGMYGLGLGLVTFIAMTSYVDYPSGTWMKPVGWLLNLGLMGLIWWSAHKLTWDCTWIDETQDASGRGVLSAAGLESQESEEREQETGNRGQETGEAQSERKKKRRGKKKPKAAQKKRSAFGEWTARWWAHHDEQKKKPHTPGVWVVYFSLAALPLFALGQSLIPRDDSDRRWATFVQMVVYVGSGLGLLVTTSLLGIRRYLRQKKAKIPASLNTGWLGLGAVLIGFFLVVGAFFPRPHSEVPWFGLPQAGKSERQASEYAQLRNSAGKGEGAEGDVTEKGEGKASGKDGESGGGKGEKGSGGKGRGKSGGEEGKGKGSSGKKGSDAKSGDESESSKDKDDRESSAGSTDREGDDAMDGSSGRDRSSGRSPPETKLGGAVQKIAGFLKWLVIAIVVVLIVIGIALAVLRYLAPFTEWARNLLDALRNWWANLFGSKARPERPRGDESAAPLDPPRPPPFSIFSNPFEDGSADGRDASELVEYTFAALDSWAWDRGHGRQEAETPLEFASRLGDEFPGLAANLRKLANLYARVAYSELPLPADTAWFLEQAWDQLIHGATAAEPVEVGEP